MPDLRLIARFGTVAFAAFALAACSGGTGDTSTSTALPAWATKTYAGNFDSVAAAVALNSTEFKNVNADCTFYACGSSGAPTGTQSNAFTLHNFHVAHGAGLSGAGKTIAIVDSGFRTTHQEFAGKTVTTYGTLPVTDHGTHVAALAAGTRDGSGVYGVAYNADLHLTSYDFDTDGFFDPANVIAGTLDAAARGAVAQNNSWGFDVSATNLQNYLAANPGASVAQGLNATLGYGASNWQSYINALNTFQNNGVIVWAMSNTDSLSSGDVSGALPYFESSLADAWITVVNGYFEVDANYDITAAARLSAPCGLAAAFCLAGDGTTNSARSSSDVAYGGGTGTSYVAPQVAGAVALLAEAFPDLTPAEWADRLLASADNSWFSAEGVSIDGTTDFGGGVTHGYSNIWGHGIIDMKAALEPIGTVSVRTGSSVYNPTTTTTLASAGLTTTSVMGDGLSRALSGTPMAVFDALNTNFSLDAGTLVAPDSSNLAGTLMSGVTFTSDKTMRPEAKTGFTEAGVTDMRATSTDLGFAFARRGQIQAGRTNIFGFAKNGTVASVSQGLGGANLSVFGFAASPDQSQAFTTSGYGGDLTFALGAGTLNIGVRQLNDSRGLLGMTGTGAFDLGDGSQLTALELGFEQALTDTVSVFGSFGGGMAQSFNAFDTGLLTGLGDVGFSGFEAGLSITNVAAGNDLLSFSIAQPLRVETGTASFRLPVGRTKDGTIVYQDVIAPLAPSGREIDLSLAYQLQTSETGVFQVRATYAHDQGHVAGERGFGAAARYSARF